jgi:cytochrome c peroxidase
LELSTLVTRLTADNYIACAHCHPGGAGDGLTWDFTQRGEGLRNTTSLLGRRGTGHGPLHWSANFDEVQDFEHDLRGPFAGVGLMGDALFHAEGRDAPLGGPKAGLSPDLDALAAFVTSLDRAPRSPWREADGSLSPAALRGRALMHGPLAATCGACHGGPNWTVSGEARTAEGEPALFDVGTLTPQSGQRLGGPLLGLDPPTLLDLWATAPYLHDGSAPTLRAVLVDRNLDGRHADLSALSGADLDDLVAFLLSLDGSPDERP